jgi:PPK2 family polyphosphate:nucleotide phosphotransferase
LPEIGAARDRPQWPLQHDKYNDSIDFKWSRQRFMKTRHTLEKSKNFSKPYRVTNGAKFRLKDWDPSDTMGLQSEDKPLAKQALENGILTLAKLQDMLYAQDKWAVLLIFQAMDAAGKDSSIKHVMSGVNPQGCQVFSFKTPSPEELDHDYLWRYMKCLPNRGHIGIFNRSYYEEVLVVRVHPKILQTQKIPPSLISKHIWKERFEDIRNFESYLSRNGVAVVKFFLHLSKEEQKRRFLERANNREKNWKFSAGDMVERGFWDDYQKAFEDLIRNTATKESPWYIVPADNKWFSRVVVAAGVIDTLSNLGLAYPRVSKAQLGEIAKAKEALMASR